MEAKDNNLPGMIGFEKAFDCVSFKFIIIPLDGFIEYFSNRISIILGMKEGPNLHAVTFVYGNI